MLSESKPQLTMNASVNDVVDGEAVTLSCSLKFHTSRGSEKYVHVMIDHPGAIMIDRHTKTDVENEVSSVVTVRAKASENTEEPTLFGPIQCTVVFTQPENDPQLAGNPVQFTSDEMSATPIQCKFFIKFIIDSMGRQVIPL